MTKIGSFLKNETSVSVESLVKTTARNLKASSFATNIVTMLVSALTVMRGLGLDEEVRLCGLLVLSHFGEKGLSVPTEVSSLIHPTATALAPQSVAPAKVSIAPAPKPVATVAPKVSPVPQSRTAPARTLGGTAMGSALGKAAASLGLGQLNAFRKLIAEMTHDWNALRASVTVVLGQKLLEPADWKALVAVMKRSLFFTDRDNTTAFIIQCPKEDMLDLLFGGDRNLKTMVQEIRNETEQNSSSPYRVNFTIECCKSVGREAKDILTNCKHAVNRMKQRHFIPADHWLVEKVSAMSTTATPLPDSKFAKPEPTLQPASAPTESDEDKVAWLAAQKKELVKTGRNGKQTFKMSLGVVPPVPAIAIEPVVAASAESKPEPQEVPASVDNGGKPAVDPKFEEEYAQLMLEEERKALQQPVNGKFVEPPPTEAPVAEVAALT